MFICQTDSLVNPLFQAISTTFLSEYSSSSMAFPKRYWVIYSLKGLLSGRQLRLSWNPVCESEAFSHAGRAGSLGRCKRRSVLWSGLPYHERAHTLVTYYASIIFSSFLPVKLSVDRGCRFIRILKTRDKL